MVFHIVDGDGQELSVTAGEFIVHTRSNTKLGRAHRRVGCLENDPAAELDMLKLTEHELAVSPVKVRE